MRKKKSGEHSTRQAGDREDNAENQNHRIDTPKRGHCHPYNGIAITVLTPARSTTTRVVNALLLEFLILLLCRAESDARTPKR